MIKRKGFNSTKEQAARCLSIPIMPRKIAISIVPRMSERHFFVFFFSVGALTICICAASFPIDTAISLLLIIETRPPPTEFAANSMLTNFLTQSSIRRKLSVRTRWDHVRNGPSVGSSLVGSPTRPTLIFHRWYGRCGVQHLK